MSRICQGCGGVLGRDCFNEQECIWISQSQQQDGQQAMQENAQLQHEIYVRNEHIKVLQDAVKEFLKVINRSPAALHHYADAIKKGEDAIGESVPV